MRVVIAPDSFKESLTAREACDAIATGVRRALPDVEFVLVPMADGGEGTGDVLREVLGADWVHVAAVDPLGRPMTGRYAWLESRALAVIEMAETSGLALLRPEERDPLRTTSRGFGMLIADALDRGARELILTIGGSATNDAGAGVLQALGAVLRDTRGTDIGPGIAGLRGLARVDLTELERQFAGVSLRTACDVTNPLLGPNGASSVYGPQKGLAPEDLPAAEQALTHWADLVEAAIGRRVRDTPGAGAAGGVGAALLALGATLEPGVDLVADLVGLRDATVSANLVITGEGSFDVQSLAGKVPAGVARIAREAGVPTVVLAGRMGPDLDTIALTDLGITRALAITPPGMPLAEALATASANLAAAAERIAREWVGGAT
ncbi:MAG: glycerate kinase [Actinomycetota bacterium]